MGKYRRFLIHKKTLRENAHLPVKGDSDIWFHYNLDTSGQIIPLHNVRTFHIFY